MPANWKDFFIIHSDPLRPVADVDQQATYWAMQRTKLGNVKAKCYARIGQKYTYRVTYDPNELCIPYPQLTIQQQRDRDEALLPKEQSNAD